MEMLSLAELEAVWIYVHQMKLICALDEIYIIRYLCLAQVIPQNIKILTSKRT